ncbi:MAG: endonuclease VII domain-containing protein [Nitrososphaera sp.]|nr:endonuclease VII domain-containing protein [Nitrososphaera sp.]
MDKKYPSSSPEARKAWLAKQDPEKLKSQRRAQYERAKARGATVNRSKAYYQANKERIKAKVKEYAANNKDKIKAASAAYYQEHAEKIKAKVKAWKILNPADPLQKRKHQLKLKYDMTLEEFDERLDAQDGRCMICKTDTPGGRGRFHVDHNHVTDQVRDLLCYECNTGLGKFKESTDLLQKAIDYLNRHATKEQTI